MSCTHWKTLKKPYAEKFEKERPETIEVESLFGRKIILKYPQVIGDSLYGIYTRNNPVGFGQISDTIGVGINEIVAIKEKKTFHESRTGSVIITISIFFGIILIGIVVLPKPKLV